MDCGAAQRLAGAAGIKRTMPADWRVGIGFEVDGVCHRHRRHMR
jgi:hypothetical protein